jgi:polysaccharide chain length determinant protein (PEP-CTERM system associated)
LSPFPHGWGIHGETDEMAEITAVLLNFLKAIGKYRWHAVVITWVVALIGWAVVLRLPNQYEASARVYVDTQSILKPLLSNMTTVPNLEQQVMFMRRTLISRPNVERLMRMVDLDVKAKDSKEHDKIVDELMSQIKITGTERDDIYTLTYMSDNPKLGKDVVSSLLTIFVEGSFSGKKQDSEKAVQFIDDQIKTYEEKLAAAENSLKEFKLKNLACSRAMAVAVTSAAS